ncbi:NAD(P)H-dependent glycerol-3-phosphate dehydrogenase [Fervidobacterium thailandense]|uniref:Glycerol-3-phosphate dehydrogenase [NAD(P)+] n=1 Tax=Fervidobacterium thailandense TaxID=1008305 RepID=A0A1E3G4C3_9BACT|nr:NAD(P)H-dependent glycerol-3-phosphate dehydrogenase [Fervidobacterium thailandense]ODN31126.1 glycerol-3-phosphate dehydrogenase [Fervidobacterium thailandense]
MKYFVLGAGSWGCTIAQLLKENGREVLLWAHNRELAERLNRQKRMPHVPDIELRVDVTDDISLGKEFDVLVIATPVQYIRSVLERIDFTPKVVLNLSKGIEIGTGKRVSEIVGEFFKTEYAVLSGPSHAEEVARKLPTAVVVCGARSEEFQRDFSNDYFRVYTHDDVVGVELAGALKNIIAIAAGILDGIGGWDNAKAALITRGLYEMMKFGLQFGAKPVTFMGLAGLGDLVVTCNSKHSRNRRYGEMLTKEFDPIQLLEASTEVVEGAYTCKAVIERFGSVIDMPITKEVYEIIYHRKHPIDSIRTLMSRSLKMEFPNLGGTV